jgi:hypothetical protein
VRAKAGLCLIAQGINLIDQISIIGDEGQLFDGEFLGQEIPKEG